jgi:hypothetical protein
LDDEQDECGKQSVQAQEEDAEGEVIEKRPIKKFFRLEVGLGL